MDVNVNGKIFSMVALLSDFGTKDNSSKNHLNVNIKDVTIWQDVTPSGRKDDK